MNIYASLNVQPIINATGTFTRLSGSLMPDEVVRAMSEAAKHYVCIEELQYQCGKVIADLTGAEAGYIVSGAQAGLVLSIAASITGLDPVKMDLLPITDGLANQVIMATAHRNSYDHAVETAGGRIVEVGNAEVATIEDYRAAISDETVAILFLPWTVGGTSLRDVAEVAHQYDLPVVVDGAGRLDEPDYLRSLIAAGADLVVFSGGKFVRGPQASGFICGRKDLISAIAWQHLDMDVTPQVWTAPRELLAVEDMPFTPRQGIGRGYKAGKEEIVGLVTALRLYAQRDHAAEQATCERRLRTIVDGLDDISHISGEFLERGPFHTGLPLARIRIEERELGMTAYEFIMALKQGEPSIHPGERELDAGAIIIHPFALQSGDAEAILNRCRQIVQQQLADGRE